MSKFRRCLKHTLITFGVLALIGTVVIWFMLFRQIPQEFASPAEQFK